MLAEPFVPPQKDSWVNEVRSTDGDVPALQAPLPTDSVLRTIQSSELMQGDREILILHNDQTYRLRVTRANRLILNK